MSEALTPTKANPEAPAAGAIQLPTPTQTVASTIAELRGLPAERVNAALTASLAAHRNGDKVDMTATLVEQAALLQALGVTLIQRAGAASASACNSEG